MTPQFVPGDGAAEGNHLSEDQFGDLLTPSSAEAEPNAHLPGCDLCSAELASIRESLTLFRLASRAHADNRLRPLPQMTPPSRRVIASALQPAAWLAATAMLLTALLPMQMQRMRAFHPPTTTCERAPTSSSESDEALLDDVDREASASLPTPMQALASPSNALYISTPLASQRKAEP